MSDKASRPARSAEAIDRDFADLMASKMPGPVARDKFETLWDEANSIAAQTVHMIEGQEYIALLKRMHATFEDRYPSDSVTNGQLKRRL
jgi:hypothetical protein